MANDDSVHRVTTPAGDAAWLVSTYDDVRTLLGDGRLGRSHPDPEKASRSSRALMTGRPTGKPATESASTALMRRLLGRLLAVRRVDPMRPRVQELVDALLDAVASRTPPVDLHAAVAARLPALVICEMLGIPKEDLDDFRRWSDDADDVLDHERSREGLRHLMAYMRDLADRRRREPAGDLVSELVAAREPDQRLSDAAVAQLGTMLLFSGQRTTVMSIDKGVTLLLANPEECAALRRDPALIPQAVEEILRCPYPWADRQAQAQARSQAQPDHGLPRYALADIEVGGVTIPRGDMVLLRLHEANSDERVFAEPFRFDICRTENQHVLFGYGPHYCLGAALARIELQTVFATLIRRFPTLRLTVPLEQLRMRSGVFTGGLAELPVSW